ncbi:pulmonary surfactant-associated protein A-like [Pipra filicauda]|uniref:Pulmonary surfactant-associated protein A-like n=1 Tax=Pipra filicauda TaxID=649802 RepID=A0A7R5KJL4_9PASS|nr:pulmonary surfactant-associated protein A-like [Pipra filicauda]
MLSYSSYVLTAVGALIVTCHALSKFPEISGLPDIPGKDVLKGLPRVPGLPGSLDTEYHNHLVNLEHRLFQLEAALALNGRIREVGEKVFATNGKKADFASALRSCEEAGGTLATPMNEEENKAIMDIVKQYKQYAYLGIKECETSGQFTYITGMPLSYTKWHQYEPNGKGKEKCVEMYKDGSWNDKKCNLYRLTICEF